MSVRSRFRVQGMTCQNCVKHVTKALSTLPGVSKVDVSLERGLAQVESESPLPFDQVQSILKEEGYEASQEGDPASIRPAEEIRPALPHPSSGEPPEPEDHPDLSRTTFSVEGMHCATCVFTIEKALKKEGGLGRVHINLATQSCDLTYDSRKTSIDRIFEIIRKAGYTPRLPSDLEASREFRRESWGLAWTALLGLPLIFLPSDTPVWTALTLSILLQAVGGGSFYRGAWIALRQGTSNMDTLVVLGTTAALSYSALYVLGKASSPMFMTQALLLLFIRFGKLLESWVKKRARNLLTETVSLLPETATVLSSDGTPSLIPLSELVPGATVLVAKGERLPADGRLIEQEAWVDLSLVTGESVPVRVTGQEELIGGTSNVGAPFRMTVTGLGSDTVLARMVSMLQEAQGDRPSIQRLADRVSAIFVPVVIVLSIISFGLFALFTADMNLAVKSLIGVLVVACPCALGLATPTAVLVGTSKALKLGVLFKKGQAVEDLSRISMIALDKTGTLTRGEFSRVEWIPFNQAIPDDPLVMNLIAHAVHHSKHPISQAIAGAVPSGPPPIPDSSVDELPGKGIRATFSGTPPIQLLIGNMNFLEEEGVSLPVLQNSSGLLVGVARNGTYLGKFRIQDQERPEAGSVIRYFQGRGIPVVLLSGDRKDEALRIARLSGIPDEDVHASLSPFDKRALIQEWEKNGRLIAMVGDGINDAASLAQASVGIAMSRGAGLTQEKGDLILIGNDLYRLVTAHRAAVMTMGKIRQNLGWAFLYNVIGIPMAGGALYPFFHLFIPPYYSGLAMALSSVTVVLNAMSLAATIREEKPA
ncbi:MAG: heavy metal translocating P-type ATPase [Leptospirales bacterium]